MNKILTTYLKRTPSLEKTSENKETSGHIAKIKVLKNQETGKRQRSDSKKHKYMNQNDRLKHKDMKQTDWMKHKDMIQKDWVINRQKGEKGNIQKDPSYQNRRGWPRDWK